jgi:hypothetical protein
LIKGWEKTTRHRYTTFIIVIPVATPRYCSIMSVTTYDTYLFLAALRQVHPREREGLKLTHPISKERKGPVNFLLMPFLSHEASQ